MNNLLKTQKWMKNNNIDLFLINRTDEFFNEYIAEYAERLKWISNFSGSAGRAIILKKQAYIFVDGRYEIQVKKEINVNFFQIHSIENYWLFLNKNLNQKTVLALDPSLHSIYEIKKLSTIVKKNRSKIINLENNPIDLLWIKKPKYPSTNIFIHDKKYAGKSNDQKISQIQKILKKNLIDYYLLTSLESIAWLLNIRGNDINYSPLALSYAVIPSFGKVEFFIDKSKVKKIKKKLINKVNFNSFNKIFTYIRKINKNSVIGLDEKRTNYYFKLICEDNNLNFKFFEDPCIYPRAQKNIVELNGAKKANIRDGITLTKFLYWLKNEMKISNTDEIKASNYLYNLRKKNKLFYSLSFETISAIDKNAALPHYKLTKKSNLKFKQNVIYLIDSGAQYFDGTTDITRTIILGIPTSEQKDRFTRVLKGHIALAKAKFSYNTKGSQLDYLARKSLFDINCDYNHGTGHGIGSFLNVHEGPQRIAKKNNLGNGEIRKNMIISNEPGFYKENEYGIRIENLIIVRNKNKSNYFFETISFAPIDLDLIEEKLLNREEKVWINNYHKKTYNLLNNKLTSKEKKWLKIATKPI